MRRWMTWRESAAFPIGEAAESTQHEMHQAIVDSQVRKRHTLRGPMAIQREAQSLTSTPQRPPLREPWLSWQKHQEASRQKHLCSWPAGHSHLTRGGVAMGRALRGARRLLSASGAWQGNVRSTCAPSALSQGTLSQANGQGVTTSRVDGSGQEHRFLARQVQALRIEESLIPQVASPLARAEAAREAAPQSTGRCGQLSHPQMQHQSRGGERGGFAAEALHRGAAAPRTAADHARGAATLRSLPFAHPTLLQKHQQQQNHLTGYRLGSHQLLQWGSFELGTPSSQARADPFFTPPTALCLPASMLPAGRASYSPRVHPAETHVSRAAAGVPVRSFAKRAKKWHGDPWRFVEVEEGKENEPVPSSRPNAGSIGGRNQKRRMAQRDTFKRVEHAKKKAQVVASNKAKSARHYASWRASLVKGLMKKRAARRAALQAAVQS